MKNVIKALLAGGALVSASAFGQTLNSNDLVVYISDSNGSFYAGDTGISLSSIVNANGSANVLPTAAALNANLGNLDAFLAQGGTFTWTIAAAGPSTNAPGDQIVFGYSTGTLTTAKYGTIDTAIGNAQTFAGVIQTDLVNSSTASSASDGYGTFSVTASQWQHGFSGGINTVSTAGLNGALTLYSLVSTTGNPSVTNTAEQITLTSTGFTTNLTSTPLPAAAWLLGSGLLGLIGVGRRRRAA